MEAQHNILSCKVFHDWSILKLRKYMHLLDGYIFAVIFDGWSSFSLHIGLEACELHFCTMRLYCKHTFIYKKLTGSQIREFMFFIVMLEHVLEYVFLCLSEYSKKGPFTSFCKPQ